MIIYSLVVASAAFGLQITSINVKWANIQPLLQTLLSFRIHTRTNMLASPHHPLATFLSHTVHTHHILVSHNQLHSTFLSHTHALTFLSHTLTRYQHPLHFPFTHTHTHTHTPSHWRVALSTSSHIHNMLVSHYHYPHKHTFYCCPRSIVWNVCGTPFVEKSNSSPWNWTEWNCSGG
jgi:hypothetical protein